MIWRVLWILLAVLPSALLVGCSQTNLADVLKAAASDTRTVCGAAVYAGASVQFAVTGIQNGSVTCSDGKLSIQSNPPAVPVGIQVTPAASPSPFGPGTPPVSR